MTNTSALRVGESFTYSIAITNFGPGIAEHTRATDILPRGFQFEGSTFASYSFSNGVLRADVGALAPGTGQQFFVTGRVTNETVFTHYLTVRSDLEDPVASNDELRWTDAISNPNGQADLELRWILSSSPGTELQRAQCVVSNRGPDLAREIILTNLLPVGVAVRMYSVSQGSCTNYGSSLECRLGALAVGQSATLDLELAVHTLEPGNLEAVITSATPDPASHNNRATLTVQLAPAADLTIGMVVPAGGISVQGLVNFSIWVTNFGPSEARQVRVAQLLPDGITYLGVGVENGSSAVTGSTLNWTVGRLAAGSIAHATITASAQRAGRYALRASALSEQPDPIFTNNVGEGLLWITPVPAVTVTDAIISEDANEATLVVRLTDPASRWISVDYATRSGTAEAGYDFSTGLDVWNSPPESGRCR